MKKDLETLVEKFKSIEEELIEILKSKPEDFDETLPKSVVKKALKEYIKKVNKAEGLFDEYQELAKKISKATSDEGDEVPELAKTVVEFRDDDAYVKAKPKTLREEKTTKKKIIKKLNKNNQNIEPVK